MYSIIMLDPGAVIIGSVRFIRATLWTDFPLDGVAEERGARLAALEICDFDGAIEHRGGLFTTHESSRRHTKAPAFAPSCGLSSLRRILYRARIRGSLPMVS